MPGVGLWRVGVSQISSQDQNGEELVQQAGGAPIRLSTKGILDNVERDYS